MQIAVMINVKDRPTELSILLQSLRTQTYQDFDIYILDDQSGTPLQAYHFFNCITTRLRMEGHKVLIKKSKYHYGVSKARQEIVDWAMKGDYKYFLRVDDDVVLEKDFIARLVNVIESHGYDIASGVTPPMHVPTYRRDIEHVGEVINRVVLDGEKYIYCGDDCGMQYNSPEVLPAHHFRSSALMTRKVHEKIKYYPTKLSKHGFREEQIFSYNAQMNKFKIGVDTEAIAWHQMTPSGGERFAESQELIKFNNEILKEFTKEHAVKLNKIFPKMEFTAQELMKETNLLP